MPPFYNDAAHLLKMLIASGLEQSRDRPYHDTIWVLARTLENAAAEPPRSHAEEAAHTLAGLAFLGLVRCDASKSARLRAIIGTAIANVQISGRRC
jgi:hypothetical protein